MMLYKNPEEAGKQMNWQCQDGEHEDIHINTDTWLSRHPGSDLAQKVTTFAVGVSHVVCGPVMVIVWVSCS